VSVKELGASSTKYVLDDVTKTAEQVFEAIKAVCGDKSAGVTVLLEPGKAMQVVVEDRDSRHSLRDSLKMFGEHVQVVRGPSPIPGAVAEVSVPPEPREAAPIPVSVAEVTVPPESKEAGPIPAADASEASASIVAAPEAIAVKEVQRLTAVEPPVAAAIEETPRALSQVFTDIKSATAGIQQKIDELIPDSGFQIAAVRPNANGFDIWVRKLGSSELSRLEDTNRFGKLKNKAEVQKQLTQYLSGKEVQQGYFASAVQVDSEATAHIRAQMKGSLNLVPMVATNAKGELSFFVKDTDGKQMKPIESSGRLKKAVGEKGIPSFLDGLKGKFS